MASVNGATGAVVLAASDVGAQPVDSDLTAIAALTTTAYGRALLALADAAAGRTALGLGSAATSASSAFDAAGLAAAAQAASQPLDSDLTAIAALTTTSYGRAFLALADAAAARTALGSLASFVFQTGRYYSWPLQTGGSGNATPTLNRLYALPLLVGEARTFDRIAINISTGGSAGATGRLGIYADDPSTHLPGSLGPGFRLYGCDANGFQARHDLPAFAAWDLLADVGIAIGANDTAHHATPVRRLGQLADGRIRRRRLEHREPGLLRRRRHGRLARHFRHDHGPSAEHPARVPPRRLERLTMATTNV